MVTVIGVRFRNAGKLYYFDPGELSPAPGKPRVFVIGGEGHRFYAALSWPVFDRLTGWKTV